MIFPRLLSARPSEIHDQKSWPKTRCLSNQDLLFAVIMAPLRAAFAHHGHPERYKGRENVKRGAKNWSGSEKTWLVHRPAGMPAFTCDHNHTPYHPSLSNDEDPSNSEDQRLYTQLHAAVYNEASKQNERSWMVHTHWLSSYEWRTKDQSTTLASRIAPPCWP